MMFYMINKKNYDLSWLLYFIILDSERSEEASGFTMVFIYLFYPVYKISDRRSASI